MKRIRNLGLAVAMALALTTSAGAASASASVFDADVFPAVLHGDDLGHVVEFGGEKLFCDGADFTGYAEAPTESLTPFQLANPTCSSSFMGTGPLKFNGCKFTFHPGDEGTEPGHFAGTVDIGPAGCGPMTYHWAGTSCTIEFYPGVGFPAEYVNEGEGSGATVRFSVHIETLEFLIPKPCGSGTKGKSGDFIGSWSVKAENEIGEPNGLRVDPLVGVYLGGEESGEPAKQPRFEAAKYPVEIEGEEEFEAIPKWSFFAGWATTQCQGADFGAEMVAATASLPLDAAYVNCTSTWPGLHTTLPTTVAMNSCHYVIQVQNVGPPYAGKTDIACTSEGDGIEVNIYLSQKEQEAGKVLCQQKLSPQTGLTGVDLENVGSGSQRAVVVDSGLGGVKYTYTRNSAICPNKAGTYSNGAYEATTTLYDVLH